MAKIFNKKCESCGKQYKGYGARFCSKKCHGLKRGKHTKETKKKISKAHKGMKKPWAKGYKMTKEIRAKISKTLTGVPQPNIQGKNHGQWKGGISSINNRIRQSVEYKEWRRKVFARDNYICQKCGTGSTRKNPLNADHIKRFADYPKLRFKVSNGRTLCVSCHEKTPTYKNKKQVCSR